MRLAILLYPGLTVLDAIGPYEVFNTTRAFDIRFVWKEQGPVAADTGALVLGATHTLEETGEADVVLVPGSAAETLTLMADDTVTAWLRAIHESTRYTTSVCSGALILGAAGLLKGKPATTHWAGMAALKQMGATPQPDARIVPAGRIITAAGVSAGIDLGLHLVSQLLGDEEAEIAQLMIEYDPQPPFDAGHMNKAPAAVASEARSRMMREAAGNPRNLLSMPKLLMRRWSRALGRAAQRRRRTPGGHEQ